MNIVRRLSLSFAAASLLAVSARAAAVAWDGPGGAPSAAAVPEPEAPAGFEALASEEAHEAPSNRFDASLAALYARLAGLENAIARCEREIAADRFELAEHPEYREETKRAFRKRILENEILLENYRKQLASAEARLEALLDTIRRLG